MKETPDDLRGARTIFRRTRLDVHGLVGLRPLYGRRAERVLKWLIRP
jgi:hypothetical protein